MNRFRLPLLIACALVCAPAAEPSPPPAPADLLDAAHAPVLRESDPFTSQLRIANPYPRAIRVALVDTSCTCTKLEIRDRFILPGAATVLDIAIDNRRRSGPIQVKISVFLTDPELEPIELTVQWQVRPVIAVDSLPRGADPATRPADRAWQDIYRFVANERPDEPQRLAKRIRIESPTGEIPPGGLQILGIDYGGSLWRFTPERISDGAWVITASARSGDQDLPAGEFDEPVAIRTNHPDKPTIQLQFLSQISKNAGRAPIDPLGGMVPPPPMGP